MENHQKPRRLFPAIPLALPGVVLCVLSILFNSHGMLVASAILFLAAIVAGICNVIRGVSTLSSAMRAAAGIVALTLFGAMLMPTVNYPRERTRRTTCTSHLKQIGYVLDLYSLDLEEGFPENLPVLYEKDHIRDARVFVCPSAADEVVPFKQGNPLTQDNMSYCYVSGVRRDDNWDCIVAFDEESNHDRDGVNVLFVPGNVEWRNSLNWLHGQLEKQLKDLAAQGRSMTILRPGWSSPPADGLSWR